MEEPISPASRSAARSITSALTPFSSPLRISAVTRETREVNTLLGGEDRQDLNYKPGACPRDHTPMLRVLSARNKDVVLDSCPVCQGIWLDAGEFERIKRSQPGVRLGELV